MSDDENSDFLADPKAYEDDQSDIPSALSRRGSENYNHPPEIDHTLRKQDSGIKNQNAAVDLRTKLKRTISESSDSMHMTSQEIPIPRSNPQYSQQTASAAMTQEQSDYQKNLVEIGMRLKAIYPHRYFIFKNMKPQYLKLCREHNYAMTPRMNENTLKSAFEVCAYS